MARVILQNLVKTYPAGKNAAAFTAVKNVDLEIAEGEFMVLVGPSGCGKSTTLRMIAGLEEITSGTIAIDGRVVNDTLPKDRDIAMVFQNYALYPHMTVAENLELYDRPANLFVAGFIGSPPMNFFRGEIRREGSRLFFHETNPGPNALKLALTPVLMAKAGDQVDRAVVLGLRPENVIDARTMPAPNPGNTATVMLEVAEPMGAETFLHLTTGATRFIGRFRPANRFAINQSLQVVFDLEQAHLFDPATEQAL